MVDSFVQVTDMHPGYSADRFDVSLPFLSQQCAWLFERHRSQLRAQVRKFKRPLSVGTSPTPDSASDSGTTGLMRGAGGGMFPQGHLFHIF